MCSCAPAFCTDELLQLDYQVTVVPGVVPSVVDLNHIRATLVWPNAKFFSSMRAKWECFARRRPHADLTPQCGGLQQQCKLTF